MEFFNKITVRARTSFYLSIAEKLFEGLNKTDEGYVQAKEALEHSWKWLNGDLITGDQLYEYLENEKDTGLMVFGYRYKNDPVKVLIWKILITSLMYTIWQAYQMENEKYLPQTIEDVDETIIDDFMSYTNKCQSFNTQWIELLKSYLLKKFQTNDSNELGNPIQKNEIMKVINGV